MTAKKTNEPKKTKKKNNIDIDNSPLETIDDNINIDTNIINETNELEIDSVDLQSIINESNDSSESVNKNDIINEKLTNDKNNNIKKRGRKPKGGKIVQQLISNENNKENKINIILHLKCSLKDLQNKNDSPVEYYNFINDFHYEFLKNESLNSGLFDQTKNNNGMNENVEKNKDSNDYLDKGDKNSKRELWNKIKQLQHNLHINNTSNKKSACFWCTYDFDNPPIYIPKHYINNSYHVYGCFCSPECSVAYLMEENIDHSVKFERYHLLNHLYCKIYNYHKNIKPAPKPQYLLDKFYGNLTIQEYRNLLQNERLFLVVDKPLTRILPELHEDNEDFIINHKMIPSSVSQTVNSSSTTASYLLKKKMTKGEKFMSNIGLLASNQ